MNPDRLIVLLLCLSLAVVAGQVSALESDRDQPINIEADRVQIDDLRGISVYSGSVVYTQGTIRLEADSVHIYHDEQRRLVRFEAFGEPVRFRQRLEGDGEDMKAHARRMEYVAVPERLVLEHDAWIWREDVEFTGDYISYDTVEEVISAIRGEEEGGRVHIVIQPQRSGEQPSGSVEVR